jgi:hypothetical protein
MYIQKYPKITYNHQIAPTWAPHVAELAAKQNLKAKLKLAS